MTMTSHFKCIININKRLFIHSWASVAEIDRDPECAPTPTIVTVYASEILEV